MSKIKLNGIYWFKNDIKVARHRNFSKHTSYIEINPTSGAPVV
jgi:hypothetical protein